jgi:polyphosphate kinase
MTDSAPKSPSSVRPSIFDDPGLFIDRDLSLIEFQRRVFDEARDDNNPLLERLNFLSIVVSNFDEFEMIRMPQLSGAAGGSDQAHFDRLRSEIVQSMREVRQYLRESLIPALARERIHLLDYSQLTPKERAGVDAHFMSSILPALMPLAFDPKRPFPHVPNLTLHLAILIRDTAGTERFACVQVPQTLPQFVELSREAEQGFVWLEQVIAANLSVLFPGMELLEAEPFRLVRHGDILVEDQPEARRLLEQVEEGVRQRQFAPVSVLLAGEQISTRLLDLLVHNLGVVSGNAYRTGTPLALGRLKELAALGRPDLHYPPLKQTTPSALLKRRKSDIFAVIQKGDVLLHHPYESFQPVVDFLEQAATDPNVISIRSTLYRVGSRSPIVDALLAARRNGKQVGVVVELAARFDEVSNVGWARALEDAGANVVYGMVDLKVHAKLILVVRREGTKLRSYVHAGSGNYNPATAQIYTDLSLFTCNDAVGADAADVFNYLTGYAAPKSFRKLLVAPINLREQMRELILREIDWQQRTGRGHLIFKMNTFFDREMAQLVYKASVAGVRVDLVVRGACCVRPGLSVASKNIRVRSIVGRFLEHSRIYFFGNGGSEEVYLGSADLRPRNLDRRVEVLVPVSDPSLVRRLRDEVLALYLADNVKARELLSDGQYVRAGRPVDEPPISIQQLLAEGMKFEFYSDPGPPQR